MVTIQYFHPFMQTKFILKTLRAQGVNALGHQKYWFLHRSISDFECAQVTEGHLDNILA